MRPLSWLRGVFHEADHPEPQPCPHQLELSRLRSQLARMTVERNEAREALAEAHRKVMKGVVSDLDRECARCGRKPALGWAWINDVRYCHDDNMRTSCYEQIRSDPWLEAS